MVLINYVIDCINQLNLKIKFMIDLMKFQQKKLVYRK